MIFSTESQFAIGQPNPVEKHSGTERKLDLPQNRVSDSANSCQFQHLFQHLIPACYLAAPGTQNKSQLCSGSSSSGPQLPIIKGRGQFGIDSRTHLDSLDSQIKKTKMTSNTSNMSGGEAQKFKDDLANNLSCQCSSTPGIEVDKEDGGSCLQCHQDC